MHLETAHAFWRQLLRPGDHVIDATCGNGRDTAFLCQLVGPTGQVIACDIQQAALNNTLARATTALPYLGCHAQLAHEASPCRLVVFNLGYLPGGDKSLTTMTNTTLNALEAFLPKTEALSITCYPGHPEGAIEEEAILAWASGLPRRWTVHHQRWLNRRSAPSLLTVQHGPLP